MARLMMKRGEWQAAVEYLNDLEVHSQVRPRLALLRTAESDSRDGSFAIG